MDKINQYVEKHLTNYRFQGKVLNLISNKYINGFNIKNGIITCIVTIDESNKDFTKLLTDDLLHNLKQLDGISEVKFVFTQHSQDKANIIGAKHVILVSSGKGGVGKSTVTFFLAQYLQKQGLNIGILDADIYGPSLPTLTKINDKPKIENGIWIPHIYNNIVVNSIGYLVPNDESLIWRGPMISKSIQQLLSNTKWPNLDYLLIDMPPGTGDIHLSIAKKYNISGAFLVSTPHNLSVADTSRTLKMYQKLSVPVLGIITNMAYLEHNQTKQYIFGKGEELKKMAKKNNVPIITQIPFSANNKIDHNAFKDITPFMP